MKRKCENWARQLVGLFLAGKFWNWSVILVRGNHVDEGNCASLEINEPVQSPTFTISRVYDSPRGLSLAHYDFYRLGNAGIMSEEIREVAASNSVVVVEWAGAVDDALPSDRLVIKITAISEEGRFVEFYPGGKKSDELLGKIKENMA